MPERAPLVAILRARPDALPVAVESRRDGSTAGMVDHAGVAPDTVREKADRDVTRLVLEVRPDPTLDVLVVEVAVSIGKRL